MRKSNSNLNAAKVSPEEIVERALKKVEAGNNRYKNRWLPAITKASVIFTSNDTITISDMHDRLEKYQTTQNECNCTAAMNNNPCYHRAYVLLRLRFAEANV
jgi:hypothetical protein